MKSYGLYYTPAKEIPFVIPPTHVPSPKKFVGRSVNYLKKMRVFTKESPNKNLKIYLPQRDFVDHHTHVDPIAGVFFVNPECLNGRKVWVRLVASFKTGVQADAGCELPDKYYLYNSCEQVYPPIPESKRQPSLVQESILYKYFINTHHFYLPIDVTCPMSVKISQRPNDLRPPIGIQHKLLLYIAHDANDDLDENDIVIMSIRKIAYAPTEIVKKPITTIENDIFLSGIINLKVELDKGLYHHGEDVDVDITIDNNSKFTIKKVQIIVHQVSKLCLSTKSTYKCKLADEPLRMEIPPGGKFNKSIPVFPILEEHKGKPSMAIDGHWSSDYVPNLASSTILRDGVTREHYGIVVFYRVKVKVFISRWKVIHKSLKAKLEFHLMHPRPVGPPISIIDLKYPGNNEASGSSTTKVEVDPDPQMLYDVEEVPCQRLSLLDAY